MPNTTHSPGTNLMAFITSIDILKGPIPSLKIEIRPATKE